jgi:flagellar biosynthetic protein FliO
VLLLAVLPFMLARPAVAEPAAPTAASSSVVTAPSAAATVVPPQTAPPATAPTTMATEDYPGAPHDINWGRQILITLLWVVVMSGVIWLTLRFFFSGSGLLGLAGSQRRTIKILDRQMLSNKQALVVVEVGGRVLLLGMTEQNINTLAELDREGLGAVASSGTPVASHGAGEALEKITPELANLFGRRG